MKNEIGIAAAADDIDIEKIMVENCTLDELFYVRDLKSRKIFFSSEVDQAAVSETVRNILQFNADDKGKPVEERKPIYLYLSSVGGDICAGLSLIDAIENSKTPVYTINLSYQYSMAFLIGLAGHKRFASKNASFLMHDGSSVIFDSAGKAQDRMRFNMDVEDRLKRFVLSKTKITRSLFDKKYRTEWYMFADEAKKLGVTDYIIGEDVSIDEVV